MLGDLVGNQPCDRAASVGQRDGGDVGEDATVAQRHRQRRLQPKRIGEREQRVGADPSDRSRERSGVGRPEGETGGERADRLGIEGTHASTARRPA